VRRRGLDPGLDKSSGHYGREIFEDIWISLPREVGHCSLRSGDEDE